MLLEALCSGTSAADEELLPAAAYVHLFCSRFLQNRPLTRVPDYSEFFPDDAPCCLVPVRLFPHSGDAAPCLPYWTHSADGTRQSAFFSFWAPPLSPHRLSSALCSFLPRRTANCSSASPGRLLYLSNRFLSFFRIFPGQSLRCPLRENSTDFLPPHPFSVKIPGSLSRQHLIPLPAQIL